MFRGFTDETFEFFMALRFNNNREFFHANHDWYLRSLREPCLELAAALEPAVHALGPDLETRPEKVVARLNRDLRFSRDKSPYRDYTWLAWHRPGADKSTSVSPYFGLSADGGECGVGYYADNRPVMNALRRRLREDPQELLAALPGPEYARMVRAYKRMAVPDGLPEELAPWYRARSFYLERPLVDFALLRSPALVDVLAASLQELAPFYSLITSLVPEDEP